MILSKKSKIIICSVVIGLIVCLMYNLLFDVNWFLKDVHVTKVYITCSDIKAGLQEAQSKTVSTTDKQEIEEIISILRKPLLYRKLPLTGNVPSNPYDRLEIRVGLFLNNNKDLEYFITSQGDIEIKRSNNTYSLNVSILGGSNIIWFYELKRLYDIKEHNNKWS